ncbi:hypothetical protein BX264_4140 [Streptomyces sp. 2333.5]|nr:hypothetical protein BX264_4140 [Streptomyces sp. 2333.5]SEE29815.1 hypothetical protein SAMN05428943_4313 [Streptomyces sp. 2314.4]SEE56950.1 hypothetical protein SAMN05428942_4241 [Streptomyces sp. 2112.2]
MASDCLGEGDQRTDVWEGVGVVDAEEGVVRVVVVVPAEGAEDLVEVLDGVVELSGFAATGVWLVEVYQAQPGGRLRRSSSFVLQQAVDGADLIGDARPGEELGALSGCGTSCGMGGCAEFAEEGFDGFGGGSCVAGFRRDLRDDGATPPDLPPALADVDPPEGDTHTTLEERL